MAKTYPIPFLCGDGSGEIMIQVRYISNFPRDEKSLCAFCHGDPCAECSDVDSEIVKYFARNKLADTCPCCFGLSS